MEFETITDPLVTADEFRDRARESGHPLPESMVLATVDALGAPHARVVLYKGRKGRIVHFFTNYTSDKAQDLDARPMAELCIHYAGLALQIRISGAVHRLESAESDAYFATRPRESQIGAWASQQSRPLESRAQLDAAVEEMESRFAEQEVPRPPHWGGYGLEARSVELWVGQAGRLHDRARYRFEGGIWKCQRLFP